MRRARGESGNSLVELVVIVAVALGLALGIQAFLVKPYRIPSESMVPTLEIGQRVLVNRIGSRFGTPDIGDITVFHPPARLGDEPVRRAAAGRAALPAPDVDAIDVNFIKRVVAGPGDRISIDDGHVVLNGVRQKEPFARFAGCSNGDCDFPVPDHGARRYVLHDG